MFIKFKRKRMLAYKTKIHVDRKLCLNLAVHTSRNLPCAETSPPEVYYYGSKILRRLHEMPRYSVYYIWKLFNSSTYFSIMVLYVLSNCKPL